MEDISKEQEIIVNPTDQPPGTGVNLNLSDIEVLRDRIEQQKANKLKAEQLVSTLSRIKAREKATRRSGKPAEKKVEDGVSHQPTKRSGTNSSNALKEKSNLLKKKLEEDRAKLESKKGQEDLGRVSEIVEHLRVQLEDQDKTIQQMHSNYSSKVPPPVQEVTPPEPDLPPEVKQKIADLEMKILDLQENLREKDSVISARTQAISLLSEDMARKGKNTLDTLEETRGQMKTMQANFVTLELRMNEEKTRLRDELEAKKVRLQQLEKNYRTAESARFDLSTRVAEVQEKVVGLQSKNLALEEEIAESNEKVKEFKEALENSNKQTIKLKAQFKAKLKAIEEERDMLRKEDRTNEELNRLRERIAELEDEKEAGHLMKERIAEMEEKLHRQESDLDSHIKAMASLEAEKLDLMEEASKKNTILKEKEDMLEVMKMQLSQTEETKISAEMKCLELEEKLESYVKTENDSLLLSTELEEVKNKLLGYQETIVELSEKLRSKEDMLNTGSSELEGTTEIKHLQDVSSSLIEWQSKYAQVEEKLNSTLQYCKELEDKKTSVERDNERLLKECEHLKNIVDTFNTEQIQRTEVPGEESDTLRHILAQKEKELVNLSKDNKELETEVNNLRYSLESTTAELHRLSQQMEELSFTQQKVEELNMSLGDKDKELETAVNELEERSRKLSEYKKFHKLKNEDVLRISHELENVSSSSQQRISDLELALSNAQKTEEDLRKEIKDIKEKNQTEPESVEKKLQEQSLKMKKLAANVKLKAKLVKDLESKIDELQKILQEKDLRISSLENEKLSLQNQMVENFSPENSQPQSELVEKYKILETEINYLKEEIKSKTDELDCLKNTSGENYETLVQIKELENQNKRLYDISEMKSEQIRKMEEEISDLNGLHKSVMLELEQMQESYKQDALKNESVLDLFESEMMGNKKDISELSNQLKDVTGKYEQTWAKLQEKEGYIEDLEQQLEKVKLRLLQIENTVEDRRRSLEDKAEMLGARLCQAEKNNEQLEKHGGQLEQKIAYLLDTEQMLEKALQRLQEENAEMSKSLNESLDKNIQLSKELENKHDRVQGLTKEVNDKQISLANYEQLAEDFEAVKTKLKESQEAHDNQVRYLENRLADSEQCMDGEIKRLLDKVALIETERHEANERFNSLLIEKQMLEEEMGNMQQTIAEVTREELEQLKSGHKQLAEEMNKELEKRHAQIQRIQELEAVLENENMKSEELLMLKDQFNKQLQENERLKFELLSERAKKQVDDVVTKAEETYFTMTTPSDKEIESIVSFNASSSAFISDQPLLNSEKIAEYVDKINELQNRLSALVAENNSLKLMLQDVGAPGPNVADNAFGSSENDDWAAVNKDEDDGWGWGTKEAMLEHEHIQKQKINSDLENKVLELEKRLCSLEEENHRVNEELKASQTKCSKLLKKVKEFKLKSDSLERNSREKSVGFDDLDFAMQEELRSQIEKLEKSLKESNTNSNALQQEKEGFLKRIDTLISGNERLIEMKERQDIEVEMWQRRSNELQNKVQGLEWTIAELQSEQSETKEFEGNNVFSAEEKQHFLTSAVEMEEKLNALAAENDYLQSLLADLKDKDKITKIDTNQVDEIIILKEENDKLVALIKTLEQKLEEEHKNTSENTLENSTRIESLMRPNELLSTTLDQMKVKFDTEFISLQDFNSLNEKYSLLVRENAELRLEVSDANCKLSELDEKNKFATEVKDNSSVFSEKNMENSGTQNVSIFGASDLSDQVLITDESPVLFRGFTSTNEDLFNIPLNTATSRPTQESASIPSVDQNIFGQQSDFFDTIESEIVPRSAKGSQQLPHMSQEGTENIIKERLNELEHLKALLSEREVELNCFKESLKKMEKENIDLRTKLEGMREGRLLDTEDWSLSACAAGNHGLENNSKDSELDSLHKALNEKDTIINNLEEKLMYSRSNIFTTEKEQPVELNNISNDSFNEMFSQTQDPSENIMNNFVEQISQLTKELQDKEVELQLSRDKNKRYKEMYYALAKEGEVASPDHSNADKEILTNQNIMLNQLLEDKESELEFMNQRVEQTTVAKYNLQDELTITLNDLETANKTVVIPKTHEDLLLSPAQPENIEEVTTLCAEIEELTKLLQEKETEIEFLRQKLDEANIERENFIDEWKNRIETYKEKSDFETARAEQSEKEFELFKHVMSDIEKQFKDEISLKEQQLMNVRNVLHSTESVCQSVQEKCIELENSLKTCQFEKDTLEKEVDDLKHIQNSIQLLTQEIGYGTDMNLSEKVKKLKDDLLEIEIKFDEAKYEIDEKDKTINVLKEKIKSLETNPAVDERVVSEEPVRAVQMKTFASEPFRVSTELSSSDDDSSSRHTETIQGQMNLVKEVQSLKQVLTMKDSQLTRMSISLNDARENVIKGEMRLMNSEEEILRQHLDEALYTLHSRDVRCDELALELTQLLEERDSLQLRLSTAIRFNEELRRKSKLPEEVSEKGEGEVSSFQPSEADEEKNLQLKQKLDQLHNVGYRRDPALQLDQQRRHNEQMHLYTHHTPQEESQQSFGLFNWIFGASPSGSQDI